MPHLQHPPMPTRAAAAPGHPVPSGTGNRAAAFYDLDGTIVSTNLVHAYWYYACNNQGLWRSLTQATRVLGRLPLFAAANLLDRQIFNELFFKVYAGESEDRLRYLSEELFEKVLKPAIFPGAELLVRSARDAGLRQIIVSGAPDFTVRPIARYLGMDEFTCNRLEFINQRCTGRVLPPVMANATKATWIRNYADTHGLRLADCHAYADSHSDLPMLAVVGHPAAVNPDTRLRLTARQQRWPILDLRARPGRA